jgi:type IV secretion system protein VirB8
MASGIKTSDLQSYFEDAQSWDRNRAREALAQKRMAYSVAIGATAVAVLTLGWHVAAPLKSVEP